MHALLLYLSLVAGPAETQAVATRPAADQPTVVVVVGAEGSAEYGPAFSTWADRWVAAAGRGQARVVQIGRDAPVPGSAETDRDRLRATIAAEVGAGETPATGVMATKPAATNPAATQPSASAAPLWVVLIGHGTSDGREAKFNLRGPDVTDQELAAWLRPCRRPLAVIDCSSASAPFLNRLSGPGRVVVTATRSGQEVQFSRFGDTLSAALSDPAADLDKDGQTSLLEAFIAASHGVEAFYKSGGRLATEHALLDDTGDGLGTPADWFQGTRATRSAKNGVPPDGRRAHQWHLVPSPAERQMPPDRRARRDELELKVQALRDSKASLAEADYYAQLEPLLLDLAKSYEEPTAETRSAAPARAGD
jgi:hypothetical protein